MIRSSRLFPLCLLFLVLPGLAMGGAGPAEPREVLAKAKAALHKELKSLDADLRAAARTLGRVGLTGDKAKAALTTLWKDNPYCLDTAAVDARGVMVTVVPEPYAVHQGEDISGQAHIKELLAAKRPVLSRMFFAVEGVWGIDAEYPVLDRDKRFIGSASVFFRAGDLFSRVFGKLEQESGFAIMMLELDGRILYDRDADQIGKTEADPIFAESPGLREAARKVRTRTAGKASYVLDLPDADPVRKEVVWDTVILYGTAWRLCVIRPAP